LTVNDTTNPENIKGKSCLRFRRIQESGVLTPKLLYYLMLAVALYHVGSYIEIPAAFLDNNNERPPLMEIQSSFSVNK
jgi:hypothetical protein